MPEDTGSGRSHRRDFDSVSREIIEGYRREGKVPIRTYNPVKDDTDTQIALEKALEAGSSRIWILGGTGTRLDHVLGNICILKQADRAGVPAFLVDEHNRISLVSSRAVLKKEEQFELTFPSCPWETEPLA